MSADRAPRVLMISSRADLSGGPVCMCSLVEHLGDRYDFHVAVPVQEPFHRRCVELVGADRVVVIRPRQLGLVDIARLRSRIREWNVDIVHTHGKGAGVVGRLASVGSSTKVVHTFHGVHQAEYGPVAAAAYRLLERTLSRGTDVSVFVSAGERAMATRLLSRESRSVVIENGVPASRSGLRAPTAEERVTFAAVMRMTYQKNPLALVDIAEELRRTGTPLRIEVVGDGELRKELEQCIQERSLRPWLRVLPLSVQAPELLDRCGGLVSTSRWEGMPLVVLEALAAGRPVVATDVVGNSDVLRETTAGALYREGDPSAAVAAMVQLAASPWPELSESARALHTERFTDTDNAQRMAAVYDCVLGTNIHG